MTMRVAEWVLGQFLDAAWFRAMRDHEDKSTRSAEVHERRAEGIRDRVTVPDGGW